MVMWKILEVALDTAFLEKGTIKNAKFQYSTGCKLINRNSA